MNLSSSEKQMLEKLGMELKDDKLVVKEASAEIEYAGLGLYVTPTNHVFEKLGNELVEVDSPRLQAERRFIQRKTM